MASSRKRPENDIDNPTWTKEDFARARPGSEVLPPEVLQAFGKRPGGRPKSAAPKQLVTLRLSPSVIEHFKGSGPGWQTRIDEVLRQAVANARP